MASAELAAIIEQIDRLAPESQRHLMIYLEEKVRRGQHKPVVRRRWREVRGIFPCPAMGEDAQAWVSRSRRESDAHRMKQWVHGSET